MLKSSSCDYNNAYLLVKGTISIANMETKSTTAYDNDKKVVFKDCSPFTNCISEINNTQIDNAKDIDAVLLVYKLIECGSNYSQTSVNLWQC